MDGVLRRKLNHYTLFVRTLHTWKIADICWQIYLKEKTHKEFLLSLNKISLQEFLQAKVPYILEVLFKHTTFLDITTIHKVISRTQEIQKKCQNLGLKSWKEMNNQCPQFMQLSTKRSLWISLNRAGLGCLISHVFLLGGIRRSSPSRSKHSFQLCNGDGVISSSLLLIQ